MLILYASRTGNIRKFVNKLDFVDCRDIDDVTVVDAPFVLITYTDLYGQLPKKVEDFLDKHHEFLIGVSASGDKNWGKHLFARSGDIVSQKYNVPIISKFEKLGSKGDVEKFTKGVIELYG